MRFSGGAVAAAVVTVVALAGCAPAAVPSSRLDFERSRAAFLQVGVDEVRGEPLTAVLDATRRLGFGMLASADNDASAVAPWGAFALLAVLREGARGATAKTLDAALGVDVSQHRDAIAAVTGELTQWLGDPGSVTPSTLPTGPIVVLGNGLFLSATNPPTDGFLRVASRYFDTGAYTVNFAGPRTAASMNEWVAVNTNDTAARTPREYPSSTSLAALGTTYLAAAWAQPFALARTSLGPFRVRSGATINTPIMTAVVAARTAITPDFTALELRYGDTLALRIVLPAVGAPVSTVTTSEVADRVAVALHSAPLAPVAVRLPRFAAQSQVDLTQVMARLDAASVFAPGADFSALANNNVRVNAADYLAEISIGEAGSPRSVGAPPTTENPVAGSPATTLAAQRVSVDRPFVYSVVDTAIELPILLGVVSDPRGS